MSHSHRWSGRLRKVVRQEAPYHHHETFPYNNTTQNINHANQSSPHLIITSLTHSSPINANCPIIPSHTLSYLLSHTCNCRFVHPLTTYMQLSPCPPTHHLSTPIFPFVASHTFSLIHAIVVLPTHSPPIDANTTYNNRSSSAVRWVSYLSPYRGPEKSPGDDPQAHRDVIWCEEGGEMRWIGE